MAFSKTSWAYGVKVLLALVCVLFSAYLWLVLVEAFFFGNHEGKEKALAEQPSFTMQYLHPYYFFSLPTRSSVLNRINTNLSWVDERGYRGLGPEAKGARKLAFVIGGSTAFGIHNNSNDHTFSAYLNRVQNEYFFVNAGVPSWVSFQELLRFLKQIMPEKPALVVSLSGINDITRAHRLQGRDLPLDAPDGFEDLERWVENIRSGAVSRKALAQYWDRIFPTRYFLLTGLRGIIFGSAADSIQRENEVSRSRDEVATEAARKFLENMRLMSELAAVKGIRFHVFFQPWQFASKTYDGQPLLDEGYSVKPDFRDYYLAYREEIRRARVNYLSDFSEVLNGYGDASAVQSLFSDSLHLTNLGNAKLAEAAWQRLREKFRN